MKSKHASFLRVFSVRLSYRAQNQFPDQPYFTAGIQPSGSLLSALDAAIRQAENPANLPAPKLPDSKNRLLLAYSYTKQHLVNWLRDNQPKDSIDWSKTDISEAIEADVLEYYQHGGKSINIII